MNEKHLNRLDRFLLVTVRYGLFLVLLLPFLVFREYLYPWVSGKIWGIEILVAVLFPLYLFLAIRRKEYRPRKNAFLYAVLIFFAIATFSMLLGDNINRSFWSKPDRQTGMFFQYHLLALFLMAGAVWRGQARKVMIFATGSALILSFHAIAQAYLGADSSVSGRGSATLGNPSYLGQYLSANLFLALWLIYHDRHKSLKWLWMFSASFIGLGIMATRSRGALVAVGTATLFAGIVLAWKGSARARKWGRRALVALALLAVLFFVADRYRPTHQWLYNQRLAPQYWKESTGSRVLLLRNATKGFIQRPVLGWGPENFESAFYFNYAPETLRFSRYETRQDRPHNIILDLLNNLGLLGLLAFSTVYVLAWRRLLGKSFSEHGERLFLALATVALLVATLFIFDTPASYLMQYVLLSLIMATTTRASESGEDHFTKWGGILALVFGMFALWLFFAIMLPTIRDSKRSARLISSLQYGIYDAETFGVEVDKLIESRAPYAERNLRAIAANISLEPGNYLTGDFLPVLEKLGDYHIERFDRNANDYVYALVTSVVLMSRKDRGPEWQATLEKAVARMKDLSPNRQEVYWVEAQVYLEKGEKDLAEKALLKAIELDPEISESKARYARFLMLTDRVDEAFSYLASHRDILEPSTLSARTLSVAMARLYDRQDFKTLEEIYEASVANDMRTVEWSLAGVVSAAATGDLPLARERADEATTRFPEKASAIMKVIDVAERGGITPRSSTP